MKTLLKVGIISLLLLGWFLSPGIGVQGAIGLGFFQAQGQIVLTNPIVPLVQLWQALFPPKPQEELYIPEPEHSGFPYDDYKKEYKPVI